MDDKWSDEIVYDGPPTSAVLGPAPPLNDDERARLEELEALYASCFRYQVPTTIRDPVEQHGYKCGSPPNIIVSERTSLVACAVCGAPLDPLDILRQYTRKERQFAFTLERLRQERSELGTEVEQLKTLRSRLRSDIKRRTKAQAIERK